MDASGNLYGTTVFGGYGGSAACGLGYNFFGCGTVFKIGKDGKFSLLHVFHGKADGSFPVGVVGDGAGNLYGITDSGGDLKCSPELRGCGNIFKIDNAGKFSILYEFHPEFPGLIMYNNLFRDSQGNLYGTNEGGGAHGGGYLFKLDAKGNLTDLYDFEGENGGPDGFNPFGAILAPTGDFYGTLGLGGAAGCGFLGDGCGTVFKLTP